MSTVASSQTRRLCDPCCSVAQLCRDCVTASIGASALAIFEIWRILLLLYGSLVQNMKSQQVSLYNYLVFQIKTVLTEIILVSDYRLVFCCSEYLQ